uniref:Ground-like domain-containing protein n=1 Tax=Panagrolaimus sp. ES5 TaxID=591445 RepID=A0AC34F858_9BILA
MMKQIVLISLCLTVAHSFLFGGSSGGSGGGCCCEPQCGPPQACCAPPPPPPAPCQCGAPQPCMQQQQPQIFQQPQMYQGPMNQNLPLCRPRYIIIRPLEHFNSGGYQNNQQQQPMGPAPMQQQQGGGGSYAQAPQPMPQAPVQQPQGQQYVQPAAPQQGPIETPQQAGYKALASKTQNNDAKCNSIELRSIMESEITPSNANESKRRIHKIANEQFETENSDRGIDVICAASEFSYRIATDLYCEHQKADITCFAFQQSQPQ